MNEIFHTSLFNVTSRPSLLVFNISVNTTSKYLEVLTVFEIESHVTKSGKNQDFILARSLFIVKKRQLIKEL